MAKAKYAVPKGYQRHERGVDVRYRFLAGTDDINAITELLHRAYAPPGFFGSSV